VAGGCTHIGTLGPVSGPILKTWSATAGATAPRLPRPCW